MKRTAAVVALLLSGVMLYLVGRSSPPRPDESPSSPPATAAATSGAATITTVPSAHSVTTTTLEPAIEAVSLSASALHPPSWLHPLAAVSAGEVWVGLSSTKEARPNLIGHRKDGTLALYGPTGGAAVLGLAVAPDSTVWAATDIGVFSFDGVGWSRQFDGPAGGVAVGGNGTVWIGGRREGFGTARLWLARWDGARWQRLDPSPEAAPGAYGEASIVLLPGGEAWIIHRTGFWVEDPLMRYDGTAMESVTAAGIPDATPDNGSPAVGVFALEGAPNADLWVAGYLAADPDQGVLARFDGTSWARYDWPFPDASGFPLDLDMAAGPDGVLWFAGTGGLRSFDGAVWTTHLEGQEVYGVDVAPDGTVWYTDQVGARPLRTP